MQTIEQTQQFSFQSQELAQKLLESLRLHNDGHWKFQFSRLSTHKEGVFGYLGITNAGTIIYSGYQPWNSQELLRTATRYISQTRQEAFKPHVARWQATVNRQVVPPRVLVKHMLQLGISPEQLQTALRLKVLNDLDLFLIFGSGEAQFIHDSTLRDQFPIPGFPVAELMTEALQRKALWQKLRPIVPSMNMLPVLDSAVMDAANLPLMQQQWIRKVVQHQRTLNQIAIGLAKDPLEVTRLFSKWVRAKLIRLEPPQQDQSTTVMIIDDSPLVLKQFQGLVGSLGYQVQVCQDAKSALYQMTRIEPAIVFIDINMPGITGFELVKQIRQQAELATVPLVILTGEQKLSNKWRAQWSNCEFLTKPLASNEVNQFQLQLQELIHALVFGPSLIAST